MKLSQWLRYGENPHQAAAFYTDASLAGGWALAPALAALAMGWGWAEIPVWVGFENRWHTAICI
jgi:hypothetical protein